MDERTSLGWWTISGEALLTALHRIRLGENPDVVYAELYANSDHEHPDRQFGGGLMLSEDPWKVSVDFDAEDRYVEIDFMSYPERVDSDSARRLAHELLVAADRRDLAIKREQDEQGD